jgi:hypothetical protein
MKVGDQEWSGLGRGLLWLRSAVVAFTWERLREVIAWTQGNRYAVGIRTHHLWSTSAEPLSLQGAGCNPSPLFCSKCFVFADTVAQGRDILSRSCLCFKWRERKTIYFVFSVGRIFMRNHFWNLPLVELRWWAKNLKCETRYCCWVVCTQLLTVGVAGSTINP